MDINMPEMNGVETAKLVRENMKTYNAEKEKCY